MFVLLVVCLDINKLNLLLIYMILILLSCCLVLLLSCCFVMQNMAQRWPKAVEADMRGHLGRYEIQGNDALKPMKFTSGYARYVNYVILCLGAQPIFYILFQSFNLISDLVLFNSVFICFLPACLQTLLLPVALYYQISHPSYQSFYHVTLLNLFLYGFRGQKSRVAFACLTYGKPHVVILGNQLEYNDLHSPHLQT